MTIAMTFPDTDALRAIAARAFGPNVPVRGQVPGIDVRPLLPAYEDEIGAMMAASVPEDLRPGANAYALVNPAAAKRAERMAIVRSLSGTGATIADLHAALGVSYCTAQEYAHIVGGFERQKAAPSDDARPSPRRDEAARRYSEGQTVARIAEVMGTTRKNVRRHLRAAGVAL